MELPVPAPVKFALVINLKTAKSRRRPGETGRKVRSSSRLWRRRSGAGVEPEQATKAAVSCRAKRSTVPGHVIISPLDHAALGRLVSAHDFDLRRPGGLEAPA